MSQKVKKIEEYIKQKHLEIIFAKEVKYIDNKISGNLKNSKEFINYEQYLSYAINLITDHKVEIDKLIELIDDKNNDFNYDKISEELDMIFDSIVMKVFPILEKIKIVGLSVTDISRELQSYVIYKED